MNSSFRNISEEELILSAFLITLISP